MICHDVMWCKIIWNVVMGCDKIWCDVMWNKVIWNIVIQGDMINCKMFGCKVLGYVMIFCDGMEFCDQMWCKMLWYLAIWWESRWNNISTYDVMHGDMIQCDIFRFSAPLRLPESTSVVSGIMNIDMISINSYSGDIPYLWFTLILSLMTLNPNMILTSDRILLIFLFQCRGGWPLLWPPLTH